MTPNDETPAETSPAESLTPSQRLTTTKRVVILLAVFFTAFHIFATFLWIAPASALRDVIPGNVLQTYMIPMHGQSWSVFAPNPINGDYRLQVRAVVGDGAGEEESDWVDATDAELTMHMHNLFPPRAGTGAHDLASRFKSAYDDLSSDQQDTVALGYYDGDDWRDRMRADLQAEDDDGDVDTYMHMDRLTSAYATQVAYAMWGEEVQQVQFIISRQNVIPFQERNDPDAERPDVQTMPTGWRGLIEADGQSRENFADTFLRGVERSGQ